MDFLKKWLLLSLLICFVKGRGEAQSSPQPTAYTSNPSLRTILSPWPGTPLNAEGRFMNLEPSGPRVKRAFWKWKLAKNPQKQEKKADTWRAEVVTDGSFLKEKADAIAWLGHSSFYVRLNGLQFLLDPVFNKAAILKRKSAFPVDPRLFENIDYTLVSHAHYDHCSKKSLKQIARQSPTGHFMSSLGMKKLIQKWTVSPRVQEAGWYQAYETDTANVKIYFLPSRHRSNRGLWDENKQLWGAFVIQSGGKTLYFGGDTGYGSHYRKAAELFPNIDVAFIAIGAYAPRWFMSRSHQNVEEAMRGFGELGAKTMIPMHYATFDQTDEPLGEPLRELEKEMRKHPESKVTVLKVGETWLIP